MSRSAPRSSSLPGVILAGGRSSRMGKNKAFVDLGGATLLSRIAKRIAPQVAALALNADPDWPDAMGLRLVADTIPGKAGPLAGVLAAMRDTLINHPQATHVTTVPSDSPFFPENLVIRLASALKPDAIAIAASAGRRHPVFGLWPVSAANDLERWLADPDHRRVNDFLSRHPFHAVDFPMIATRLGLLDPFLNINTPDDLAAAGQWLEVFP